MKAYLVLENGMVFEGRAIGCWPDSDAEAAVGELVFTTGMTGYLETLTDPSYAGQIIMQTFPMIGNYGVISQDFEGKSFAKGYVVHELIDTPSNFRSEGKLDAFLKEQGIPGICGVDTRALTRLIRENGVMNACQSSKCKVQICPACRRESANIRSKTWWRRSARRKCWNLGREARLRLPAAVRKGRPCMSC